MNKRELAAKCKHILEYGENWGFMHVRGEIAWREMALKKDRKELDNLEIELKAYKKLLSNMKEKREIKKLIV